jgi:hypothetical protein
MKATTPFWAARRGEFLSDTNAPQLAALVAKLSKPPVAIALRAHHIPGSVGQRERLPATAGIRVKEPKPIDERPDHEILRRRTFAIISHPDAGKTTLTEKLLLFGGAIQLAGELKARGERRRVRSDWMAVERERASRSPRR